MRIARSLVVAIAAACGKDAPPPPPPPPPAAATIAVSTPVPSIGNSTWNDLGAVTIPNRGDGAVIALLSGHVTQACHQQPCPWTFALGVCRDPTVGGTVADACHDGRAVDSLFAWAAGSATDPIVITVPVAIAGTFPVDGVGDTVLHLIGWAPMPSRLEGELTVVYTPAAPLGVQVTGLVQPPGDSIAP